jgi:hypothetical protein
MIGPDLATETIPGENLIFGATGTEEGNRRLVS